MKEIRIADQPRLGFARTLRIAVDGIRYRLFRASVTVAVIAVAVAFLMNILSESFIKRAVARDTRARIERARLVHAWSTRLTAPATPESVLREFARAQAGAPAYGEIVSAGALPPGEAASLHEAARRADGWLGFFERLDYARRRRLAHTAAGVGILDAWAAPGGAEAFLAELRAMPSVRFPAPPDEIRAFARDWPAQRARVERILAGYRTAAERVRAAAGRRPMVEALAGADGAFGDAIRSAGFRLDAADAAEVARQARRALDVRLLEKSLDLRPARQLLARHYDLLPGDVTVAHLWRHVGRADRAAAYLSILRGEGASREGLEPGDLAALAGAWREEAELARAERGTADVGGGWMGLGLRMGWLLAVSMLVCAIGISNAMLMTVTERFREIATLKCLGALDGFIMLMFVLESCLLGVVGGIAGGALGGLLGAARMWAAFGGTAGASFPLGDLGLGLAVSVGVGVALAAVAAVYPSFRAARLAPMEAMRVE